MALMRVNIEKRTIAGLAAEGTVTFAHGLGATPDVVHIRHIATLASSVSWINIAAPVDATNVTLQNFGRTTSPDMEVIAMRFHSLIQ